MKILKKNELYYVAGGNVEDKALRRKGITEMEDADGCWVFVRGKDIIVISQGKSKH